MSPAPIPTGIRTDRGIAITRRFPLPPAELWHWLTDPDRTAQWFGRWSGDPSTGEVAAQLSAEEGAPMSTSAIHECTAPQRLVLGTGPGWVIALDITADSGVLTGSQDESAGGETPPGSTDDSAGRTRIGGSVLTLSQDMEDAAFAAEVGPGWEYYLDRLVAATEGCDAEAIAFEPDYLPGMAEHYRALFTD